MILILIHNQPELMGPSLSEYPAGTFINDYEFRFQYGDLDQYNGRFCKTPEYPEGTYAYFITIDASEAGLPVFPYILALTTIHYQMIGISAKVQSKKTSQLVLLDIEIHMKMLTLILKDSQIEHKMG